MSTITIPYSRQHLRIEIPDENLAGVFKLENAIKAEREYQAEAELVNQALDNPIASRRLEELAMGKNRVVIITSDHTRPVPSKITLPILLERVRKGNKKADITILVATGCHRATSLKEQLDKFGENIVNNEKLLIHNAFDDSSLILLGMLPSGGECRVNKLACDADLLIAEGFIEPHFFAGFSGGRKSVLPGVAGAGTVLANHCSEFIADPNSRTGNLASNPVHRDMLFAAKKAGLAFIMNVVLDENKKIIKAVAGNFEKAHLAGCEFVEKISRIEKIQSDIVVTSNGGYPLDQNIYQSVKGMTAAEAMCKPGGTIIMIAGCEDGHGGQAFYEAMADAKSPTEVLKKIARIKRSETRPDQWQYQILARILSEHKVILVSDLCNPEIIREMHMEHAFKFDEALAKAFEHQGKDAKIAVVPDGVSVIVN